MGKFVSFIRSMRFGIILLCLIAVCSVVGSVIPQGREMTWYVEAYPKLHVLLFSLRLDNVFSNWYFVLMMSLLALNLTLCSIVRVSSVIKSGRTLLPMAAKRANTHKLSAGQLDYLEAHLESIGCRKSKHGTARVYSKNLFGRYGSFITHLSILLTIIFGAAGLYLPQVTDMNCLPGESVTMPDGTEIAVSNFYIENDSGQLDFTSDISITLGETGDTKDGSIRVNYPLSCGPYKVYQQTYGTAGKISVTNIETGGTDSFVLTDHAFLSLDGVDGLWFLALYPDYYLGPDGSINPVASAYGRYDNPVYHVQLCEDGVNLPELMLPGDVVELGGLGFTLEQPVEYPGLRIKYTPPIVNTLLFAAFALMILGIYITFFMQPVLVKLDDEGYVVSGPKPEGMQINIETALNEYNKGNGK